MFENYDVDTIVDVHLKNADVRTLVVKKDCNGIKYLRSLSAYASNANDIYDEQVIDKIEVNPNTICLEDIVSDIVRNLRNVQQYLMDNNADLLSIDDDYEHMFEIFAIIMNTLSGYCVSGTLAKTYVCAWSNCCSQHWVIDPYDEEQISVRKRMYDILKKV